MTEKTISRRQFLKASVAAIGAVALAGGMAGCMENTSSTVTETEQSDRKAIETPSFHYGDTAGSPRVLVAYATRTGSTIGVASAIGEELGKRGFSVDVSPMKDNPDVKRYDIVLLGSAINGGQWLPEAISYVEQNQQALDGVGVAVFSVHIMNTGDDEKSHKNRLAYLDTVNALIHPVEAAFFAGMGMNAEEESAITRWVYRTFKIGGEGDCRDWNKIRGWAETLEL